MIIDEKISVVVAEDDFLVCEEIIRILKQIGCEPVFDATNGEEAVEVVCDKHPDVVLMDIAMPKKHGIDAIREIRQMDPDARIIGVTALYSPEKKREALKAGASSIIVKPFDVSDLIREIEALFRNKTDAR